MGLPEISLPTDDTFIAKDGAVITYTAPPLITPTLMGITPSTGNALADMVNTENNYGVSPDVWRLFFPQTIKPAPVGMGKIVVSCNDATGLSPAIAAEYFRVIFQHEADHLWIAAANKAQFLATWKAEYAALLKAGITNLAVSVTADLFENPNKNPADFLVPEVPVWYVDNDGVTSKKLPYHSYMSTMNKVDAFAALHGLTLGCGELASDRITGDVDGLQRAMWLADNAAQMKLRGYEAVCLWEYKDEPLSLLTLPAEKAMVHTLLTL